ncbi:hypothetical protein Tsubulata_024387 [Turnera subulata]|uniref:Uncharacterized protein n=1 Tax=Turnera subulata TaxID=218843 RepID=A0A9Q0F4D1_9ROSI|nr:hypothetical protein Tsubulata_024387 [Turnera subulata]
MAKNVIYVVAIVLHTLSILLINCESDQNPSLLPKFPAILVFGDSTVDSGNNNYIPTIFRANFYPYGKDYENHTPTGRFSDGKLVPDMIASSLGIKEAVPPFLMPNLSDHEILTGVTFASAGSGFDDLTTFASHGIPVLKQLQLFKSYKQRLERLVGRRKASKIIGDALVMLSAGTNDFAINYYDIPTRKLQFDVSGYQDFILTRLQNFTKELYNLGCRSMVIIGLPPIGCLPIQMTAKLQDPFHRHCLENQNADAQSYNQKLVKLLLQTKATLKGSRLEYGDIYGLTMHMINNPQKYGFVETKRGCCGTGLVEGSILCNSLTPTCEKPSTFLFWDSIHPTQATYQYIAKYILKNVLPKF